MEGDPPLQAALRLVVMGVAAARTECVVLISRASCKASLVELWAAHELLVTTVREGEIPGEANFNGQVLYWFNKLYRRVRYRI